jgi:glycosyltransferase involved in cell wall biosynthesis
VKVALVCDWFAPRVGGIELHLRDLAARLITAGREVVIVTPTPGSDTVDGIRVARVTSTRAPHFGFLMTRAGVRALGDAMAAERPDVVHAHVSIVSPAALGGARYANERRLPLVVTFHSVVPQMQALARVAGAMLGASRWHACFSAVSERVACDVAPFAMGRPIHVLPNGIDVDFWRATPPSANAARDETTSLLTVMRLNPKKRPLALVGLMKRLATLVGPRRRIRLRVAGDGPWRARLGRAVERSGLSREIVLLGHQSREQLRDLLAESDMFVLPTILESFGLAALEARCAGVPVVAMRASGVAEHIVHDVNGLLADSDAELALHVALLARDPVRRAALASWNRETTPPVDWPQVLERHLALYRQAIDMRRV